MGNFRIWASCTEALVAGENETTRSDNFSFANPSIKLNRTPLNETCGRTDDRQSNLADVAWRTRPSRKCDTVVEPERLFTLSLRHLNHVNIVITYFHQIYFNIIIILLVSNFVTLPSGFTSTILYKCLVPRPELHVHPIQTVVITPAYICGRSVIYNFAFSFPSSWLGPNVLLRSSFLNICNVRSQHI